MLKLDNVCTVLGTSQVVREVCMEVDKGEFVSLLGSNGAGKTTLFRTIAGVLKPVKGTIEFKGKPIHRLSPDKVVAMGLVLCPEGHHVFPALSVYKNLMLGAYVRRHDRKGVEKTLDEVYELFPILKERRDQAAGTLSGGERQMLAIGRAMMSKPELLLLDEPSLGLAPLMVQKIAGIIKEITERGTTVLLSEQNANMALNISHRGYVLENGALVLQGLCSDLICNDLVKKAYIGA